MPPCADNLAAVSLVQVQLQSKQLPSALPTRAMSHNLMQSYLATRDKFQVRRSRFLLVFILALIVLSGLLDSFPALPLYGGKNGTANKVPHKYMQKYNNSGIWDAYQTLLRLATVVRNNPAINLGFSEEDLEKTARDLYRRYKEIIAWE